MREEVLRTIKRLEKATAAEVASHGNTYSMTSRGVSNILARHPNIKVHRRPGRGHIYEWVGDDA